MPLRFDPVTADAVPALTDLMRTAFDDETRRHTDQDRGGPPGYDDGTLLTRHAVNNPWAWQVADERGVVGVVIAFPQGEGRGYLGCLVVAVERQREGLGRRILAELRARLPEVTTWTLDTPERATSNHRFYEACGFLHVGSRPGDPAIGDLPSRQYQWDATHDG